MPHGGGSEDVVDMVKQAAIEEAEVLDVAPFKGSSVFTLIAPSDEGVQT